MTAWGHIGVEVRNKGVLRSWNIQAKTKPEDNLDQSEVCWQSPEVNEKHLAYKKHVKKMVVLRKLMFFKNIFRVNTNAKGVCFSVSY